MDNEFLLYDRLEKIKSVINKYGEENFFIAYSGGKDSVVLSNLIDMAIPSNTIPRVYADTGIELNMIRDFVRENAKSDTRIHIIQPTIPIKKMLIEDGYPFKSKLHSEFVYRYQISGRIASVLQYLGERTDKTPWSSSKSCPRVLKYQFTPDFNMKISVKCCLRLKEEPVNKWSKSHKRPFAILGIMPEEGGRRVTAKCLAFKDGKLKNFSPLVPITKAWEDWFIQTYNIKICDIYSEPYNFPRTGCKGCPFASNLQHELDVLEKFFPAERKQCEIIWQPVYEEYRRIGYRLKKED